jgi:phenylalanyl-tRNA synthetase beta subunit
MVLRASHRATELIREIASGTPAKEIGAAGEVPANPVDVSLSYEKCDRVVGVTIKPNTVDEILERFGLRKARAPKPPRSGKSRVIDAICGAMSILSKKLFELMA